MICQVYLHWHRVEMFLLTPSLTIASLGPGQRVLHLRLGSTNPVEDIGERGARVAAGAPTVYRRQAPVIGKIDAHVGGPGLSHRRDG